MNSTERLRPRRSASMLARERAVRTCPVCPCLLTAAGVVDLQRQARVAQACSSPCAHINSRPSPSQYWRRGFTSVDNHSSNVACLCFREGTGSMRGGSPRCIININWLALFPNNLWSKVFEAATGKSSTAPVRLHQKDPQWDHRGTHPDRWRLMYLKAIREVSRLWPRQAEGLGCRGSEMLLKESACSFSSPADDHHSRCGGKHGSQRSPWPAAALTKWPCGEFHSTWPPCPPAPPPTHLPAAELQAPCGVFSLVASP